MSTGHVTGHTDFRPRTGHRAPHRTPEINPQVRAPDTSPDTPDTPSTGHGPCLYRDRAGVRRPIPSGQPRPSPNGSASSLRDDARDVSGACEDPANHLLASLRRLHGVCSEAVTCAVEAGGGLSIPRSVGWAS